MTEPLTAADRCDRCPAAAQVRALKRKVPDSLEELEFSQAKYLELLFCGHHYKANHDAMVDAGWSFV